MANFFDEEPEKVVPLKGARPSDDQPKAIWHSSAAWSEADIPPRPWLCRGYLMTGAVTIMSGAGSAGKSSLAKAWACSLALGKPYGRLRPDRPMRVMTYNVEDDLAEERRRISATLRQFNARPRDLDDRLCIIGPDQVGTLVELDPGSGRLRLTAAMQQIQELIEEYEPDVVILDPLVELHNAEENDNGSLRAVLAFFRALAVRQGIAVLILHHTRKGTLTPGDPDSVRGAGAIVGAARVVMTVNTMTQEEASKFDVLPDDRRRFFRLDDAKQNYAPIGDAQWFERVPHTLDNGEEVACAEPWEPPSPWDGMTWDDVDAALSRIAKGPTTGELYSPSRQAKDSWAGSVLVDMGRSPDQAHQIIKAWLENNILFSGEYTSPSRNYKAVKCIHVNDTRAAEMRAKAGNMSGREVV